MTLLDYYNNVKRLDTPVVMRAGIPARPKGRPRFGKSGHAYTPKETREFETQIRVLAASAMGHRLPYSCPIKVTVRVTAPVPASYSAIQRELAEANLIVPSGGDLDNRVKAVTDAMNGIVYHDDRQIGETISKMEYGAAHLIQITVERAGLSDLEIDRYKKQKKVNNVSSSGGRSPTVG